MSVFNNKKTAGQRIKTAAATTGKVVGVGILGALAVAAVALESAAHVNELSEIENSNMSDSLKEKLKEQLTEKRNEMYNLNK